MKVNFLKNKFSNKSYVLFLVTILMAFPLYGQSNQDAINQSKLYNEFRVDFYKYEKQHGHYIQTNNVKMHYLEWGNPKNPTLIWIHGTYSNGYELYEIIDDLVKMNLHVIAIDYYGHGFTDIPKKDVSIYHVVDDWIS